jgi:hypothetical protein
VLVLAIAACDPGAYLVAENQSNQELVVRAVGTIYDTEAGHSQSSVSVVMPARTKVVVVELPFAGAFNLQRVDVLTVDCAEIGSVTTYGSEGLLVVVHDDLNVELRDEFPRSGTPETPIDRCALSETSPAASPPTASSGSELLDADVDGAPEKALARSTPLTRTTTSFEGFVHRSRFLGDRSGWQMWEV